MKSSRRKFFSNLGGALAVPVAGISKALGMVPKPPPPAPFKNGDILSADDMNKRFADIHKRIDEA